MRPRDVAYSTSPDMDPGLHALRAQLTGGGYGSPPDILGPITSLDELRAVCQAMLSGRGGPYKANRISLADDVKRSLGALGSELRECAGAVLVGFQLELAELSTRLETPQGARVVALSLTPLLERLAEPAIRQAAWRDALNTFTDHYSTAEACELRVLQLAELTEHGGEAWARRAPTLEYVLGDVPGSLTRYGETERDQAPDERGPTGVPLERRLEICEEVLAETPLVDDVAVWLVVDNASLAKGYQRVGPVEMFDHGIWPAAARPGGMLEGVEGFSFPPELADRTEAELWFSHLPDAEHRLFVRIWLPDTSVAKARDQARETFQAMIDLARPNSLWIVLDGSAAWRAGGGWWGSTFQPPETTAQRLAPPHPVFEGTAEALGDFASGFVERLLAGDKIANEAVEDALWSVVVERAPAPAQRIVLSARSLERTLSQAQASERDTWAVAAERFLEAPWVELTLLNELLDAGVAAMHSLGLRRSSLSELHSRAHDTIFPPDRPGQRPFDQAGLAEMADEVLLAIGDGYVEHRIVREAAAVLCDPQAASKRVDALRLRFQRLLKRGERQRNAVIHGSGTSEAVMKTVDRFMADLASLVAQEAMRQAETGQEPLTALEQKRIELAERRARLAAGEPWLDVVPGP